MVIKNSLSVSCLFQSVIRGLFVGFYGVFLWLVMPDENKYLQVLRILGVNNSTVVFQIAPILHLFPEDIPIFLFGSVCIGTQQTFTFHNYV